MLVRHYQQLLATQTTVRARLPARLLSVAVVGTSMVTSFADRAIADDANVEALKQEIQELKHQQKEQQHQFEKKLQRLEAQIEQNHAPSDAQPKAELAAFRTETLLPEDKSPPKESVTKASGVKITFGGYAAAEGVFRDKDQVTSIGSAFQKIPFDNLQQAHVNELRATAQQSRLTLLAEGNINDHEKYAGYIESDFLGAAGTANSVESNSYTPRLRQFYGTYDNTRDGWHFLAGQSWSLVTMFKSGLIPRQENVPLTIDAQYLPGFDWLRNTEIRIVKDWDRKVWLGIEAASPQAVSTGAAPFGAGGVLSTFNCNSQLDPQTSCSLDFMPDVTVKLAVDPGWGHYEIFGLARGFRDRIIPGGSTATISGTSARNDEAVGFSGGGDMILPIWGDKLQLQGNVLYGQGIGRYDAAQLADFTFNADGSVAPLTGYSIMAGLTSHNAIKDVDLYAYAGENHVFNHISGAFGFGNPASSFTNVGCDTLGGACAGTTSAFNGSTTLGLGQIQDVWQVTGGFWHRLYDGDKGVVAWGLSDSYTVDTTPDFGPAKGGAAHADMNVVMSSFRYYPKYGTLIGTKP